MRSQFVILAVVVQTILLLAHEFIYKTWTTFWGVASHPGISPLAAAVALLSVSFVAASLLAYRYSHGLVRFFYTISVTWLGTASFFLIAACLCWIAYAAALTAGSPVDRRGIAVVCFGLALAASLYGLMNAAWTRVNRITVRLPNLPESWRGRVAALVSDTHLGHVRNFRFIRRIVARLARLRPDIVFIGGDLYDGTAADLRRLAEPWADLSVPLGSYFVSGNHDDFSGHAQSMEAVAKSGVRVLDNEKVTLDGLQIVGVNYRDSTNDQRFRSVLRRAGVDRDRASILLTHAPYRLPIAEEEGISLQLSGHTHGGQFFPFTWITSRVWGPYVYGLKRLGNLLVYTSSGVGTWGPPMRVGTRPEIVLIQFE